MAADLILNAVTPFPGAEAIIPIVSGRAYLVETEERWDIIEESFHQLSAYESEPDNWGFRVEQPEHGFEMIELVEGHDEGVSNLHEWFEFDRIPIGPFSTMKAGLDRDRRWLPGPVVSLSRCLGIAQPVVLTPAKAAEIMVALNVADHSYYKDIAKQHLGYKAGRRRNWRGYYTMFTPRRHKRQQVKRWLAAQMGDLGWLTTE